MPPTALFRSLAPYLIAGFVAIAGCADTRRDTIEPRPVANPPALFDAGDTDVSAEDLAEPRWNALLDADASEACAALAPWNRKATELRTDVVEAGYAGAYPVAPAPLSDISYIDLGQLQLPVPRSPTAYVAVFDPGVSLALSFGEVSVMVMDFGELPDHPDDEIKKLWPDLTMIELWRRALGASWPPPTCDAGNLRAAVENTVLLVTKSLFVGGSASVRDGTHSAHHDVGVAGSVLWWSRGRSEVHVHMAVPVASGVYAVSFADATSADSVAGLPPRVAKALAAGAQPTPRELQLLARAWRGDAAAAAEVLAWTGPELELGDDVRAKLTAVAGR